MADTGRAMKELNVTLADISISLYREMVAYETLWNLQSESLKTIAERFSNREILPSELLHETTGLLGTEDITGPVEDFLNQKHGFSVILRGCYQYPGRLRDAKYPVELFYYRGDIGLLESPAVAVVGARDCTPEGEQIAGRIARRLARSGYTISSGLARGIDTAAVKSAMSVNGRIIGVIGTPIDVYYPKENKALQEDVARAHLLVSHVPFYRYHNEPFKARRYHFPARNTLMSAASVATVIVEASDKSGTLTQARACLEQGRLLCITENCFRNPNITWPNHYLEKGAYRVSNSQEVLDLLKDHNDTPMD